MTHTPSPDEILEGEIVSKTPKPRLEGEIPPSPQKMVVDASRILRAGCVTILLLLAIVVVLAVLVGSVLPLVLVLVLPFALVSWWLSRSSRR